MYEQEALNKVRDLLSIQLDDSQATSWIDAMQEMIKKQAHLGCTDQEVASHLGLSVENYQFVRDVRHAVVSPVEFVSSDIQIQSFPPKKVKNEKRASNWFK